MSGLQSRSDSQTGSPLAAQCQQPSSRAPTVTSQSCHSATVPVPVLPRLTLALALTLAVFTLAPHIGKRPADPGVRAFLAHGSSGFALITLITWFCWFCPNNRNNPPRSCLCRFSPRNLSSTPKSFNT
jgi:hypothetical protein